MSCATGTRTREDGTTTSAARQSDRSPLLPSKSSSSCTRRSPAAGRAARGAGQDSAAHRGADLRSCDDDRSRCSVPQMVDQLADILMFIDTFLPAVAEQVIEVPKILEDNIPQRTMLCEPQLAEQLVEVPTVVSLCSPAAVCRAER